MAGAVAATVYQRGIASFSRCSLPLLSGAQSQKWIQKRGIVSKALRDPDYKRPAPYPYKEKTYNFWRAYLDDVTQRFDENSKIVVVDGPPTGNKAKFAKEVADELDMLYVPGANLDSTYVNAYGHDIRQLNDQMPASTRTFDIEQFLRNPKHKSVAYLQFHLMQIRFNQYIDAIAHVLNTGQGVVMNRSIYSDVAFMDTLAQCGMVSKKAHNFYYECRFQGMVEFMRPHLVIYLDVPVDQVIKNVKARNRPEELDSPFYTPEVLTKLETNYKQNYLKSMSQHAEMLVYDWSEEGEAEVVVEDICRIDFDRYTRYDEKLKDWLFDKEWDWKYKRIMFSSCQHFMNAWLNVPKLVVPELLIPGEDLVDYLAVKDTLPGNRYEYGFNKDQGDKYLFKLKPDIKL